MDLIFLLKKNFVNFYLVVENCYFLKWFLRVFNLFIYKVKFIFVLDCNFCIVNWKCEYGMVFY